MDRPRGFGLIDGVDYIVRRFQVSAAVARTVAPGDAVSQLNTGLVHRAQANDGVIVVGVVISLMDADKLPTTYLAASTGGYASVALAEPGVQFTIQDDGDAGAAVTVADVGATANHVDGGADTYRGVSTQELDRSDIGAGLQLRILGKVEEADNVYGADNVNLRVEFNESIRSTGQATI